MMRKRSAFVLTGLLAVLVMHSASRAFEEPSITSRSWQLDFTHGEPRTISVKLADGTVRWFWYMPYQVINHTGEDQLFIPEFVIATDAGDILTAGQNVPASAWPVVANKLNNKLLESPAEIVGKLLQGEDYARESVAIWPVPAHDVDEMSIFVGGISGETATTKNPLTGEDVLVRRSLMITYAVPGTVVNPQDQAVKLVEEKDVMR